MRIHVKRQDIKHIQKLAGQGLSAGEISERLEIDKDRVAQFMPDAEPDPRAEKKAAIRAKAKADKNSAADEGVTGDGE